MFKLASVQLGKNGLTENFMGTLKNHFKNHENVKVSVLKSGTREKAELNKIAEDILEKLGNHYTARVIGFTIVLKKWRKPVRE